jgi:2'-5' RNA ligase
MASVFIGILLPDTLKDSVVSLQENLKNLPIECKFVERENLHISLDFIGEVAEGSMEELGNKITAVTESVRKFDVEIGGLKLIPNEKFVRVIALDANSRELSDLGKKLKETVGGDVKPPHITLCRVKKILAKNQLLERFMLIKPLTALLKVTSIKLIRSELRPNGPAYETVSEFLLS